MHITIRQETEADYKAVFELTEAAFRDMEISDHREQFLVEKLRKSSTFIPQLSLVACLDNGKVVGHILLTKLKIVDGERINESLSLAPVSVLPEYQNQGIGSQLIETAHELAREMGYSSIILVGHEHYYPRFGYQLCRTFGISLPFEVPDINAMAIELTPGALAEVSGMVEYDPAFFNH